MDRWSPSARNFDSLAQQQIVDDARSAERPGDERGAGPDIDAFASRISSGWCMDPSLPGIHNIMMKRRRCPYLGRVFPKDLLVRFVLATDEMGVRWVIPDVEGKLPGRGAYLSPSRKVVEGARQQGVFNSSFKVAKLQAPPNLADLVERQLLRLTQRLSLEALSDASGVKDMFVSHDCVMCSGGKASPGSSLITDEMQRFSSALDGEIEKLLGVHSSKDRGSYSWMIQPEHGVNSFVEKRCTCVSKYGSEYSRNLFALSHSELRSAAETLTDAVSKERAAKVLSSLMRVDGAPSVPVLENVSPKLTLLLSSAQLRLDSFRSSSSNDM